MSSRAQRVGAVEVATPRSTLRATIAASSVRDDTPGLVRRLERRIAFAACLGERVYKGKHSWPFSVVRHLFHCVLGEGIGQGLEKLELADERDWNVPADVRSC